MEKAPLHSSVGSQWWVELLALIVKNVMCMHAYGALLYSNDQLKLLCPDGLNLLHAGRVTFSNPYDYGIITNWKLFLAQQEFFDSRPAAPQ